MFQKIKDSWSAIKAIFRIKETVTNMKLSELSTSSGRSMLVMNAVNIYLALQGVLPAPLVAKIAAVSVTVYTLYRAAMPLFEAIAKLTPTNKDDKAIAELKSVVEEIRQKVETK